MKNNLARFSVFALLTLLFTSCIKNNVTPIGDGGSSFLKIAQAPVNTLFFSPFTEVRNVALVTLRRDVNSNSALSMPMTVKVEVSSDSVAAYNTAHNSTYAVLPDSLYTLGSGITKAGNVYTLTFGAGEFEKDFTIGLNGAKWDLSKIYALAFKIVDSAGSRISSGTKNAISLLSIKNQYDGIYSVVSGVVTRYTAPGAPANDALSGNIAGNPDLTLATVGTSTVQITGLQWAYGNNSGVAGIDNLRATINPSTNQVAMTALGNTTLANWEMKENRYDPDTRTFYLNFRWNPTANRREYTVVLKYKGPR